MKKRMLVTAMAVGLAATAGAGSAFAKDAGERVWIGFHEGQQASLQRTLQREGAEVHFEFNDIGAVVATLSADAVRRLKESGSVKYIEPDHKRYPMGAIMPYGIDLVQSRDVWDADRDGVLDDGAPTGAGVTVCVIDSGLTASHQDFADVNVIGGYPSDWDQDPCGHGTHVAGTIAAALNGEGVVGVSPGEVSLWIEKVFGGAQCDWTYASTLVEAANRCADEGATVINMSLGGPGSNPAEAAAFQALRDQGVLSVAAAGNGGDTSFSYPASYDAVVSVGGVDSQKAHYPASQRNSQVELAAPGMGVISTVGYKASEFSVAGQMVFSSAMEGSIEATVSGDLAEGGLCLTPLSGVEGKIVLCQRGEANFSDKALNAVAGGAAGVVIYNNIPGLFSGTLGGVPVPVPVASISLEDGVGLVADSLDLSASLDTTFTYPASGYDAYTGTSMASPHVAGAAAVAWSENPELSVEQVVNALIAGAEDLGAEGRDNLFGHGLIQLADTIDIIRSGDIPEPPPPPPPPSSQPLTNGVLVELDPIPAGEWARYYIDVPAGAEDLVMELRPLTGATGDGDLYVRFGAEPTTTTYDCRPYLGGSNETCSVAEPQEGRYYVWVNAWGFGGPVANVTLEARYEGGIDPDAPVELSNGVPVEIDFIEADGWRYFYHDLPAGNSNMEWTLSELAGTAGDADLYIRIGDLPTLTEYNCRSWADGSNESCFAIDGQELPAERYYIGVYAWPGAGDVENIEVQASWDVEIVDPSPSNLAGTTSGARMRPTHNLTWDGGDAQVDVWHNGNIVHTGENTGAFSMQIGLATGMSTWQVCNAGTEECSAQIQLR